MGKPCANLHLLTQEYLYNAYCIEKKSIVTIAHEIGCRSPVITKALEEYGLFQRMTKEWMIEHYVILEESVDDIAQQLDCAESHVRYFLRRFDIPIRYKSRGAIRIPQLNDREWVYRQYVTNQLSICQIADLLECGIDSVQNALVKFDIPRRPIKGTRKQESNTSSRIRFSYHKTRLILQRDNYQCQWPGCQSSLNLEVHHIVPARLGGTNSADNGITLCYDCHTKTFGKETEFISMFQTIVASYSTGADHSVSTPLQLRFF